MKAEARPGYALYILILLVAIISLSYADRYLFSILMPAIKEEFGASDTVLGLIAGPGFMVTFLLLSLPVARLADRWSRRKVLAICAIVWSSATAACGMAGNVTQIALSRAMVGAGESGAMPAAQSMVASLFSEKRRSTAIGVLSASTFIGAVIGFGGGGVLAETLGWRETFLLLAAPGIPLAILLWFTGPKRENMVVQESSEPQKSTREVLRFCWNSRALRYVSIGAGFYTIFGYAGAIWMPSYLIRSHDMSVMEAGIWLGFGSSSSGVVGAIASGFIIDRLLRRSTRWQLMFPGVMLLISFPLTLSMMMVAGGLRVADMPVVALLSVANGFFSAMWLGPSLAAIASLASPKDRAQAAAIILMTVTMIGSIFGPMIAGIASEVLTPQFGEEALRYGLVVVSLFVLAASICFFVGSKHYAREIAAVR